MTVYFIGAGPGDPDLITVRGRRLIRTCPVCLYAGSLVPNAVVASAPADATVVDTAPLTLDEIIDLITKAHAQSQDVARVHSGDPSLYGAINEQIRRLEPLGIETRIIPGVPAFVAAAAAIGQELTIPDVAQSIILTRTARKATAMPSGESLAELASPGRTMIIHLSARNALHIERELIPIYGHACPAIIAYRIGWPDQKILRCTLGSLRQEIRQAKITRTALIFIGPALDTRHGRDSLLYDPAHRHILRPGKTRRTRP